MLPNHLGTPLSLSIGQSLTFTQSFTMNQGWNPLECEVVAFIQDVASKEIYQGAKVSLGLTPLQLDAALSGFTDGINETLCGDTLAPVILLKNDGLDTLTSLTIGYRVNGGATDTLFWSGNLPATQVTQVSIPPIGYAPLPTQNNLLVWIANPNGTPDQNPGSDTLSAFWDHPSYLQGEFQVVIKPDNSGSEITWEVTDPSGVVVYSGGPYQDNNTAQIIEKVDLNRMGCHEFNFYDSGGNGFGPNAYFQFRAPVGAIIGRGSGTSIGFGKLVSFEVMVHQLDASLEIIEPQFHPTLCGDYIAPTIILRNEGADTLRSIDINYVVNSGILNTLNWTGRLSHFEADTIFLPGISFVSRVSGNLLSMVLTNPNGMPDEDPSNNLVTKSWDSPMHRTGDYQVIIQLDNNGSEITWEVIDFAGAIIFSGGPYADNNASLVMEKFSLDKMGCHTFQIYDSSGDGLDLNGYFEFRAPDSTLIGMGSGTGIGFGERVETRVFDNTAIHSWIEPDWIQVFPNPTHGEFSVTIAPEGPKDFSISIFQLDGRQVFFKEKVGLKTKIDLTENPQGLYIMKVSSEKGAFIKKMSLY